MEVKKRKAINFDLSTEELKKHFGDTREPYSQIKNFMLENGFEHRQYSGYASIEVMSDRQIAKIARKLNDKFAWISSCIQEFDVTDIGEQYSLSHIFKDNQTLSQTKNLQKDSKQEQIKTMQEAVRKASQNLKPKDKSKDLDR
nr:VapD family protein [Campylobacter helveticus]